MTPTRKRPIVVVHARGADPVCYWQDRRGRYRCCPGDERAAKGVLDMVEEGHEPWSFAREMPVAAWVKLEALRRSIGALPVFQQDPDNRAMVIEGFEGGGYAKAFWKDPKGSYRAADFEELPETLDKMVERIEAEERKARDEHPESYPSVLPVEVLEYLQEQELEIVGIEKARLN
jgi:hypothetical protein